MKSKKAGEIISDTFAFMIPDNKSVCSYVEYHYSLYAVNLRFPRMEMLRKKPSKEYNYTVFFMETSPGEQTGRRAKIFF